MAKNSSKVVLLQEINKNKDILFGAFSPNLTKNIKAEKWKDIHELAVSHQLIKPEKEWHYCRDTLWPNLRKRTMAKVDNAKSTGTGGGKEAKLNEIDNLVPDILGKDSPVVCGIGTTDSFGIESNKENVTNTEIILPQTEQETDPKIGKNLNSNPYLSNKILNNATFHGKKWITENTSTSKEFKEEQQLKKRNLELQIEYLEHDIYKKKLEILQLEKLFDIKSSKYTENLNLEPNTILFVDDANLINNSIVLDNLN